MTAKLAKYAQDHDHEYHEVLRKRSMGLALAAPIADRLKAILGHHCRASGRGGPDDTSVCFIGRGCSRVRSEDVGVEPRRTFI
jgi:hypothetical protein